MYGDEDLLMISMLQHFLFCPRQCALIHIEQIWADNIFTIQGDQLHQRVHSETFEKRPNKISEFGIAIKSDKLGLTGKVDALEFHSSGSIVIVEYKRGSPKPVRADEVQLCAQALCLEEMKNTYISEGYIYYGKTHHRHKVFFDENLRIITIEIIDAVRKLIELKDTPPPIYKKNCKQCSLFSYCLPEKMSRKRLKVKNYLKNQIQREDLIDEKDA